MAEKAKTIPCPDCFGTGHVPQVRQGVEMVKHCGTCKGRGRVPAPKTSTTSTPDLSDEQRREFFTGDNT